ncbi:MAG: hypothetical protein DCC49_06195 [Acidobacteria bacterium]|nr:MAG: hypothetical protein DCC49_06195 [Acidobacteriota bacterium]
MSWLHLVLLAAAAAAAVLLVRTLDKKNRREIVAVYGMPTSVAPDDFGGLETPVSIILFTHADCRACSAAKRICQTFSVPMVEVDGRENQAVLDRYGIDGVPTTLVVDAGGTVLAGWVGPLVPRQIEEALADAGVSSG